MPSVSGFFSSATNLLPKVLKDFITPGNSSSATSEKTSSTQESIVNYLDKKVTIQHITGQLVHPNGDPLNSQKIALFSPGWFSDTKIQGGETVTDMDGNFSIKYEWKHRPYEKQQDILLQVFEETVPSEVTLSERMIDSIPRSIPISEKVCNVGKVLTKLYESQVGFPALRVDDLNRRPQQSTLGFNVELVTDAVAQAVKTAAGSFVKLFSSESGQKILTDKDGGVKLSAENTLDFLLNGTYPGQFRKGKKENEFINVINWNKYIKAPAPPLLPNTTITLIKENDKLRIKEIALELDGKVKVYTPLNDDGKENPEFTSVAQFLYNSTAFVKGEAEDHLVHGHLMAGQIALSFFRHINNHPIKKLLTPHLEGVTEINRLGSGLIFGETGILALSALPPAEIDRLLKMNLSWIDFATYAPRQPISSEHRFAAGQQLYWKIVTEVVDQFFAENAEAIRSKDTWHELYYMSQNLMKESLPYVAPEADVDQSEWVDRSELDRSEVPGRVEYDGHIRTIRPFITSKNTPNEADIEKVKQLCRYSIFITTFYHWAVHSSQFWGTNVDFASLAPQLTVQGNEIKGTTDARKAARQALVAKTLVNFDAPTLVENKNKAIYQPLIKKLLEHKEAFAKLGYDVTKIHSAIWI